MSNIGIEPIKWKLDWCKLILIVVVAYLAVIGKMDIKDIYLIIIGFYFGTQAEKKG